MGDLIGDDNLVLIGMPWSGKSTIGVLLAKFLGRSFIDTDVSIQVEEGQTLQDIINSKGADALQQIEERFILSLACKNHVIATGGSVVYSDAAIQHLKRNGRCVYLRLPLEVVEARASDIESRGLVKQPGQGLADLYRIRTVLYEKYADITLDCQYLDQEGVLRALVSRL